jgi:hypothetical protein
MGNKSILDENIFVFLHSLSKDIAYPRANKFPELAKICSQYGKSNTVFEDCLISYDMGWIKKRGDLLPDLVTHFYKTSNNKIVECKIDQLIKKPDYTFKKIPLPDSLSSLFLGEETKCCQSIDGAGREVVKEGMSSYHSAFYTVLDKKNRTIMQSWGWINDGKFCFDSTEYTNVAQRRLLPLIYEPIAQKIIDEGFSCVHVGTGGETPLGVWKMAESLINLRKENAKSDAIKSQYVIHPGNDLPFYERFVKVCEKNNFLLEKLSPDAPIHELVKLIVTNNPQVSCENYYQMLLFLYRYNYQILTILLENNDFATLNMIIDKMGDHLTLFLYVPDQKLDSFLLTIRFKMWCFFAKTIGDEESR